MLSVTERIVLRRNPPGAYRDVAKTFDYLHQMFDAQAYFAGCVGRLHNDCLPYRRANRAAAEQYSVVRPLDQQRRWEWRDASPCTVSVGRNFKPAGEARQPATLARRISWGRSQRRLYARDRT
jgi:hypothetical protein